MNINKICILLSLFIWFWVLPTKVNALNLHDTDYVQFNLSAIPKNGYISVSGTKTLTFGSHNTFATFQDWPMYYKLTFCTDSQTISNYTVTSSNNVSTLASSHFFKTDVQCNFPGSTYTGGRLMYLYGSYNSSYNCDSNNANCGQNGGLNVTLPNTSSWTLYDFEYGTNPYEIDYSSNTIITKINNLTDDSVNNNTGNNYFNNFTDNHHGLSTIITAPLNMINSLINVDPTACSDLSTTYEGKNVVFSCGKLLWGHSNINSFYNFYNLVVGGALCYWIIRDLFLTMEALKDPDNDKVEVMKL